MWDKIAGIAIILAVVYFFVDVTRADSSQKTVEDSYQVSSGGTLTLKSDSGSISIESHSKETVEVEVRRKGKNSDNFEVSIDHQGDDVLIVGERKGSWISYNLGIHYEIKVPEKYNVNLKTGGGSISLADLNGEVNAKTSGGSISLGRIAGDIEVNTSGGSISVDEVMGEIDAHTSGGSIKATISKQPKEDSELSTSGGSISVRLAEDIAVDLYAKTSGGRVSSEFDIEGTVKKTKIRGKINGGGPNLELKTSGGSVRIKKL
jgi:hypothetical protein